ncbi:MAG TPA: hypothetical protein VNM47_03170 [Terriglobia bacterium]|nr:hypothetical protein [Terriglobia bacterium]
MKRIERAQGLRSGAMMAAWCILAAGEAILFPLSASGQAPGRNFSTDALQIELAKSNDIAMSPEFRVAIYENLIEEITKASGFQHVYRSGDRRANDAPDLLTLRTTVEDFKRGSEKKRQVTTVAGWTIIKTEVQLVAKNGNTLMDRRVEGKVRLFGGNLKATGDLARKVARLIRQAAEQRSTNPPGNQDESRGLNPE